MVVRELPLPPHFDPAGVGEIWRVPYQTRATEAAQWAQRYGITKAAEDQYRIALMLVDVQNTFCIPGFELFVGGRSGTAAVDDNRRLCEFLYRNLGVISQVIPTMDTHQAFQIFHSIFLVDEAGQHPAPLTQITMADLKSGRWRVNPNILQHLGIDPEYGQHYLGHYIRSLEQSGKYDLTIWPYHAMLGGIGHALVAAVEEAVFFHSVARYSQPDFQIKGSSPLTEHYSVLGPEVTRGPHGETIAQRNEDLVEMLLKFDVVLIAGQAKSHCVAWTIADLLSGLQERRLPLADRVYLLEDCTSPVVIPGGTDYTEAADRAFKRFADAGMHVVRSTQPLSSWLD